MESALTQAERKVVVSIAAATLGNMQLTIGLGQAIVARFQAEDIVAGLDEEIEGMADISAADQRKAKLIETRAKAIEDFETKVLTALAKCEEAHKKAAEGLEQIRSEWGV